MTLLERIQGTCRFILTFRTPNPISALDTYIPTGPFLPSQSSLSIIFSIWFTKPIKMPSGKLLSWPAPPLGHTNMITCMSCSLVGATLPPDPVMRLFESGIPRLGLQPAVSKQAR